MSYSNEPNIQSYLLQFDANLNQEVRVYLERPKLTLGRREDNDVVLNCKNISKHHATLEKTESGWVLFDNRSANGVQINGKDVKEAILRDGDRIQLGTITLFFVENSKPKPAPALPPAPNHQPQQERHQFSPVQTSPTPTIHVPHAVPEAATPRIPSFSGTIQRSKSIRKTMRQSRMSQKNRISSIYLTRPLSFDPTSPPRSLTPQEAHNLSLVQFLPSTEQHDSNMVVRTQVSAQESDDDFLPAQQIHNHQTLADDYEKLRLAYTLSKLSLTDNIDELIQHTLDLLFTVLPADRAVIGLSDPNNPGATPKPHTVRFRDRDNELEQQEIMLSTTVLKSVCENKVGVITTDAFEDPLLKNAASIAGARMRSVLCVPFIAHGEVLGFLHLDSSNKINAFNEKDLALVKAISNQTAIALQNSLLLRDIERDVMIRENLGRFLPPHVVEAMIDQDIPISPGGRQTEGTVLFADIRGFTQYSEAHTADDVVELLNSFFEKLVEIVFLYNGVLDKYIGDCLMATFGTLEGEENPVYQAVAAALQFKVAIAELNAERAQLGFEKISIGVGLNSGPLVAGFIGSTRRLEYTVIGDTVNTASRICSLATENQVLISETTYFQVQEHFDTKFVGGKMFKGKQREVNVYEVLRESD